MFKAFKFIPFLMILYCTILLSNEVVAQQTTAFPDDGHHVTLTNDGRTVEDVITVGEEDPSRQNSSKFRGSALTYVASYYAEGRGSSWLTRNTNNAWTQCVDVPGFYINYVPIYQGSHNGCVWQRTTTLANTPANTNYFTGNSGCRVPNFNLSGKMVYIETFHQFIKVKNGITKSAPNSSLQTYGC